MYIYELRKDIMLVEESIDDLTCENLVLSSNTTCAYAYCGTVTKILPIGTVVPVGIRFQTIQI